jgi:TolB protein
VTKRIATILALIALALVSVGFLNGGKAGPTAGPDVGGKIAYVKGGAVWIYEGGESRRISPEPGDGDIWHAAYPALSWDGIYLAYTMYDEGFSDLIKVDLDEPDEQIALTSNRPKAETGGVGYADQALWAMHPAWSPDGRRLAFTTDIGTQYPGLYTLDPNSARRPAQVTRLTNRLDFSQQTIERPSWSPDGSRMVVSTFTGTRNGKGQIWSYSLENGRWVELTNAEDGAYDPAWSPDGAWIAFTMRRGTSHDVYIVGADAEAWEGNLPTPIRLTTDGKSRTPAWSPDGTSLAYLSMREKEGVFDIYSAPVETSTVGAMKLGSITRITNENVDGAGGLSWGP